MAVTYVTCGRGGRYMIPGGWTVYRCGGCGQLHERSGTMWFPRREAKDQPAAAEKSHVSA